MSEDLTAKARLRDAAIALVAESGVSAATARAVAERAGVSLGLIRHHFGSMHELIRACDRHIAELIRARKTDGVNQGLGIDALAAIRGSGEGDILAYLAMRLGDESAELNELVDRIVDDAVHYLDQGVEAGLLQPSQDERARAAILTLFALGSLTMHRHIQRHFGVDVCAPDVPGQPGFARYLRAQTEVFAGVLEPAVLAKYLAAIDQL